LIRQERLILAISLAITGVILAMGSWWIYLILKFDHQLKRMLLWEGGSFFVFLLILSCTLVYLFLVDRSKGRSLKIFLASMTHELKTPLASLKLQAEVIDEVAGNGNKQQLSSLTQRLLGDAKNVELQFDKILQLSKIELNNKPQTTIVNVTKLIEAVKNEFSGEIKIEIEGDNFEVEADYLALTIIFRNLFENSIRHGNFGPVKIKLGESEKFIIINYQDKNSFSGDLNKLGTIFYKHSSPKGSGIGLYLSKKIIESFSGSLAINSTKDNNLIFTVKLIRSKAS